MKILGSNLNPFLKICGYVKVQLERFKKQGIFGFRLFLSVSLIISEKLTELFVLWIDLAWSNLSFLSSSSSSIIVILFDITIFSFHWIYTMLFNPSLKVFTLYGFLVPWEMEVSLQRCIFDQSLVYCRWNYDNQWHSRSA